MRGLVRMLELKGGVTALGLGGLLGRMVLWIDCNSTFLHGKGEGDKFFRVSEGVAVIKEPNMADFVGVR
jgi:hypothetical protein